MAKMPSPRLAPETPMNISTYSFEQLMALKRAIDTEIDARKAKEIEVLRAKVAESAQNLGVSIHELFGLQSPAKRETKHARGKQPAKYRGPKGEEWSGRGPAPRWLKALLTKGKPKDEFLIK
jgi:DNA-binding protein H-NS